MSLSYELNGALKEDIGAIIGAGAQGLKKVIKESWDMYARFQKTKNRVEEEKPKLRILLKDHEEGVTAEILSESETIRKLTKRSLDKHVIECQKRKSLGSKEFFVEFPERLLGMIIGKKGSGLNRILKEAIYQDKKIVIHRDDVETARTARLRVSQLGVGKDEKGCSKNIIDFVDQRANRSFLGWPPSEDDKYEQYITLTLTFDRNAKSFTDQSLFIERLSGVINERVQQIMNQDEEQMDEINECLGFESD
jgi:hypothetical protein